MVDPLLLIDFQGTEPHIQAYMHWRGDGGDEASAVLKYAGEEYEDAVSSPDSYGGVQH